MWPFRRGDDGSPPRDPSTAAGRDGLAAAADADRPDESLTTFDTEFEQRPGDRGATHVPRSARPPPRAGRAVGTVWARGAGTAAVAPAALSDVAPTGIASPPRMTTAEPGIRPPPVDAGRTRRAPADGAGVGAPCGHDGRRRTPSAPTSRPSLAGRRADCAPTPPATTPASPDAEPEPRRGRARRAPSVPRRDTALPRRRRAVDRRVPPPVPAGRPRSRRPPDAGWGDGTVAAVDSAAGRSARIREPLHGPRRPARRRPENTGLLVGALAVADLVTRSPSSPAATIGAPTGDAGAGGRSSADPALAAVSRPPAAALHRPHRGRRRCRRASSSRSGRAPVGEPRPTSARPPAGRVPPVTTSARRRASDETRRRSARRSGRHAGPARQPTPTPTHRGADRPSSVPTPVDARRVGPPAVVPAPPPPAELAAPSDRAAVVPPSVSRRGRGSPPSSARSSRRRGHESARSRADPPTRRAPAPGERRARPPRVGRAARPVAQSGRRRPAASSADPGRSVRHHRPPPTPSTPVVERSRRAALDDGRRSRRSHRTRRSCDSGRASDRSSGPSRVHRESAGPAACSAPSRRTCRPSGGCSAPSSRRRRRRLRHRAVDASSALARSATPADRVLRPVDGHTVVERRRLRAGRNPAFHSQAAPD